MAELILAGLAFPAAVIGTTELLVKYGHHLAEKSRSYTKAPQTVKEFQVLGTNLYEGTLSMLIDEAARACEDARTLPSSKEGLDMYVGQMAEALKASEVLLHKVVNKDGSIKGLPWVLEDREKALRKCLIELERIERQIESQLRMVERHRERAIADNHLSPTKFKDLESSIIRDTDLRFGTAQMKIGDAFRTVSVIYEKRASLGEELDVLKANTSELARSLSDPVANPGILKCLGYQVPPPTLVFEVPSNTKPSQTLWRLLLDEMPTGARTLASYAGSHSLQARFKLSLQLSEAVLSVHTRNLVHKNIRSNSILLFSPIGGDTEGIGTPYLCDWEIVHKTGEMSITDPNMKWQEDIYRHPERQNFLHNLPAPNMGHDIYSLGVCLLEVGIWEPLIVERSSIQDPKQLEAVLSDTVSQIALQREFIKPSEIGSPNRTLEPYQVRLVLKDLAEQFLPSRMGPVFTGLVISCLNCLDATEPSPFGNVEDLLDSDITGSKFIKLIMEPLGQLRV